MANTLSDYPLTARPMRALFRPLVMSASGMSQQQRFMETIMANIANADTTKTPDGGPYQRQVAVANGSKTLVYQQQGFREEYLPGHPDADPETGIVRMPNVNIATETVDLMSARIAHEANATAFTAAKQMLRRALEI